MGADHYVTQGDEAHMVQRKPEWLRINLVSEEAHDAYREIKRMMREKSLHTVCEEAKCPNIHECWANKTATFMILGSVCTRACRFCAVTSGQPTELDWAEPERVAEAVEQMGLRHCVVTSVARDDVHDGGAAVFVATIEAIRARVPACGIEVLIPDFGGQRASLAHVLEARPDIVNHNIETVRRMTPRVRAKATYDRSLELLARSKEIAPHIKTKSSLMIGIGEQEEEIIEAMDDLRACGVDILTIGQYLQPTKQHVPIDRYYTPEQFAAFKRIGLQKGFRHVESGPLVRSSYHAHEQVREVMHT
jgi:lipoic acid synthetase